MFCWYFNCCALCEHSQSEHLQNGFEVVFLLTTYLLKHVHVKGIYLLKALTCMKFFLYKQKNIFFSRRRIPLTTLLYKTPQNTALGNSAACLSVCLELLQGLIPLQYCDTLGELYKNQLHEHALQLSDYNIWKFFRTNVQISEGKNIYLQFLLMKFSGSK